MVSLDLLDGDDALGAGLFQRKHGGSAFKAGPKAPPNIAEKETYHIGLILGKNGVVDLVGFRELSLGLEPHSEETLDAGGLLEAFLYVGQTYLCDMRGEEVKGGETGFRSMLRGVKNTRGGLYVTSFFIYLMNKCAPKNV